MKILTDLNKKNKVEEDARRLVKRFESTRELPLIASVERALVPRRCENCDNTYWASASSYSYYCSDGCRKAEKFGFS